MGNAAQAQSRPGWMGWLRRVFGVANDTQAAGTKASSSAQRKSAVSAIGAAKPTDSAAREPATYATYLEALGIEPSAAVALTDAELAEVERIANGVLQRAKAEQSGGPMAVPSASLRILNLVAKPDVEMAELTRVANQDPAISAAVLRVANSVALGPASGEVRTVREAVVRLGVTEVGRVAGSVAARTLFSPKAKAEHAVFPARWGDLHLAASTIASGSAYLAMQCRRGRSDMAFMGGMLHDVGKSVALGAISAMVLADEIARDASPAVLDAVIERVHVELGGEVHVAWSLPQYLVELCASHHDANVPDQPELSELHLVRVVSGLYALRVAPLSEAYAAELMQSIGVLGIKPLELRALDAELRRLGDQMKQLLAG